MALTHTTKKTNLKVELKISVPYDKVLFFFVKEKHRCRFFVVGANLFERRES